MTQHFNAQQVAAGQIEPYAFPGGYGVVVCDDEGNTFHAECAVKDAAEYGDDFPSAYGETPRIFEPFIHWEGVPLYCDHCNGEIPSEYGDPDAEEADKKAADDAS